MTLKRREHSADHTDVPVPRTAATRGRVLVVADDVLVVGTCVRALRDDHDVVALGSGRDAAEQIRVGVEFDVMLCDAAREMDAIKFHAAIWKLAPRLIYRIVFLVNDELSELAAAFLESARTQVLTKPLVDARLRELVRSHLE